MFEFFASHCPLGWIAPRTWPWFVNLSHCGNDVSKIWVLGCPATLGVGRVNH